jgi:hypothetical protein
MHGHLLALIPGQRAAQLLRQLEDSSGQRRPHAFGGEPVGQREQHHIAAVALDQGPDRAGPLAEHQVTFPMAGHRPVSRLWGSLADVEGVAQLASPLGWA